MAENTETEFDWEAYLNLPLGYLCDPVFRATWPEFEKEERDVAVENFRTLIKFVEKMRKSFDDTLTVAQQKGQLEDIKHIRKPYNQEKEKPETMVDLLKSLKK